MQCASYAPLSQGSWARASRLLVAAAWCFLVDEGPSVLFLGQLDSRAHLRCSFVSLLARTGGVGSCVLSFLVSRSSPRTGGAASPSHHAFVVSQLPPLRRNVDSCSCGLRSGLCLACVSRGRVRTGGASVTAIAAGGCAVIGSYGVAGSGLRLHRKL